MAVVKITKDNFIDEVMQSGKPVLIDFYADWCGPCRMLAPVIEEVSEKYDGQAIFVKLDVDENEEAAMKYSISSIPNVIAVKKGQPIANSLGYVPPEAFEAFVEKNL